MSNKFYEELELDIQNAYQNAVDPEQAARLAAKFLLAQLEIGRELATLDLDARMKKTNLKSLKAVVYLEHATPTEGGKKPTEATLAALVDSDKLVGMEQGKWDEAEVTRNQLENLLAVCRDGHIFFRKLMEGKFE